MGLIMRHTIPDVVNGQDIQAGAETEAREEAGQVYWPGQQ